MRKNRVLVGLLLVAVLLSGILLAGCKETSKSVDYFPLGVGSYWEYNVISYLEINVTKLSKEIIKVVNKERVGDRECYVMDQYIIDGPTPTIGQYREYLAKSEKGIECTRRSFPALLELKMQYPGLQTEIDHSPAEERFRNYLKDGETWKWEGMMTLMPEQQKTDGSSKQAVPKIVPVKGTIEYKYLGKESIHVLNNDYLCIKISSFAKNDIGQESESTIWYAPNIGRVREERKFYIGSKSMLSLFEICNYNITNKEPFKTK